MCGIYYFFFFLSVLFLIAFSKPLFLTDLTKLVPQYFKSIQNQE